MERHEAKIARELTRSGAIAAAVYNVNLKKGARALGPADIFPTLNHSRGQLPREATDGELQAMFSGIAAQFNRQTRDAKPETRNGSE